MATSRRLPIFLAALAGAGCATQAPPTLHVAGLPLTLAAPDGTRPTLDELRGDAAATVLVFWSGGCPCVRRYQQRVDALLDDYPADRVRVFGISSNAGESYDEVLQTARERGVRIPIYRDEGGRVAAALGARTTPTIIVLDVRGDVRFFGWLDNEHDAGDSSREPWLDHVLTGLLAGKDDFPSRSTTFGCPITRSLSEPACDGSCSAHAAH
jgi:hypothetical protein